MRRKVLIVGLAPLMALTLVGSQVAAAQLGGPTPTICVGPTGTVMNPTAKGSCPAHLSPVTVANQGEVAALASQQQTDMTAIGALQAQQQTDMTAIQNLKGQQSTDVTAIAALQSQQQSDVAAIAALQSQQQADMTAIQNLQTQQATDVTDIGALQTQQSTDVANISTLQSDVKTLQTAPKPTIYVYQQQGTIADLASIQARIDCGTGAAINGGARWVSGGGAVGSQGMRVTQSYPESGDGAWFTEVYNNSGGSMVVSFYAVCLAGATYGGGA